MSRPPASVESRAQRIVAIDSLRGFAAVLVMLFHFTTQYDRLYEHASETLLSLKWGHLGVNLFFMISGFVILMTIERSRTATDFLVSRFSRLYPAYWVAVGLTFAIVSWLGLPKKEVSIASAALNLTMIHGFFSVPHVDGVYWTLEVELLYYLYALLIFRLGLLDRLHWILFAWLTLPIIYWIAHTWWQVDLPWIAYRYLILAYIPYFVIGMAIYMLSCNRSDRRAASCGLLLGALLTICIVESIARASISIAFASLLYLAAEDRLKLLRARPLVWLGAISYALYLLHENIGWAVIRRLEEYGVPANLAIVAAIVLVMSLASLLCRLVEQPAMHAIRQRYKQWKGRSRPASSVV